MTLDRVLDWIEYVAFRGTRKAWCELTGGHDNKLLCAWTGRDDRASHIRLYCIRCRRETRWFQIMNKPIPSDESGQDSTHGKEHSK